MKLESASLISDAMIATLLGRIDPLSGENASIFHCESLWWFGVVYIARLYCRDDKHQFLRGKGGLTERQISILKKEGKD